MHAQLQQLENSARPQPSNSVLFPNAYTWLVLAASLDIIMTHLMLSLGAIEVNAVANHALQTAGLWGLIALKFTMIACVLWVCEYIGRRRFSTARSLIGAGVTLNFLPVVFSFAQLIVFFDDWVRVFLHG